MRELRLVQFAILHIDLTIDLKSPINVVFTAVAKTKIEDVDISKTS